MGNTKKSPKYRKDKEAEDLEKAGKTKKKEKK